MPSSKIIQIGNPILTQRALPIQVQKIKNKATQALIDTMIQNLKKQKGNGLAAPQVKESLRIIVLHHKPTKKSLQKQEIPLTIIVNPVIMKKSEEKELGWETCLSIANGKIYALVPRHKNIKLIGFGRDGKKIDMTAKGFKARIIQHEIDHLDGKLFFERVRKRDVKYISDEVEWVKHHKTSSCVHLLS